MANISRHTVDGKPWIPSKHDRVCSQHFVDSDYQHHTKTKTLVPSAIPSIFPHNPKHKRLDNTPQRPLPKKRSNDTPHSSTEQPKNKVRRVDILNYTCLDHPFSKESLESDPEKQVEKNKMLTAKFVYAKREFKILKTEVKRQGKKIDDLSAELKAMHVIDTDSVD